MWLSIPCLRRHRQQNRECRDVPAVIRQPFGRPGETGIVQDRAGDDPAADEYMNCRRCESHHGGEPVENRHDKTCFRKYFLEYNFEMRK